MKMKTLVLLLIFVIMASSLQLKHMKISKLHLATQQQKQAYLQELLKIENQLDLEIDELAKTAEENQKKIHSYDSIPETQKQVYQQAFDEERNKLFNIESNLSLPLSSKGWGCQNLTQEDAERLNNQIITTQKKIHDLEDKINNQPECPVTDQTQKQIKFLKLYINHLSEELQNLCDKPASFKTYYLPASNSNYIYGKDGEEGYRRKIKEALEQGYKTVNCDKQKPFPQSGQCIQCPQGSFFDLTQSQCIKCPDGYTFNETGHICSLIPLNSYNEAQNFKGSKPIFNQNLKSCGKDTPFFNGQQCIKCDYPRYFDFGSNSCSGCDNGLFFNLITKLCGYAPHNTNPNGPNICCGTITQIPGYQTCPENTPYYNGKQCINCDLPSYFDLKTYSCKFCPQNQGFSLKTHRCLDTQYVQPIYNSTITESTQNYFGIPPKIDNRYENVINCAEKTPFYDKKQCTQCKFPSYFSFETYQCLTCDEGKQFSSEFHKCILINSDKFNSNMTTINNFKGQIRPFNPKFQTCPGDRPFFNGHQCIQCSIPKYVDFEQSSCLQCKSGAIFNLFNRQCVIDPQQKYTNLEADNIYYNGDFSLIEKQIQNVKQTNPQATKCAINIPYYNAVSGQCQSCPSDNPLFDYKYNRCIRCPGNSEYRKDRHICLTSGNVTPTIERMMMNTIGFL